MGDQSVQEVQEPEDIQLTAPAAMLAHRLTKAIVHGIERGGLTARDVALALTWCIDQSESVADEMSAIASNRMANEALRQLGEKRGIPTEVIGNKRVCACDECLAERERAKVRGN